MNQPRVLLTAPASGSGKTLITCGILQALVNRGLKVASFKCGPDYIDPMFHAQVIGTKSRNLDSFFCDDGTLRYLYARTAAGADISVIEGVMGYYDGITAAGIRGSSYEISEKLAAPTVLIVNTRGASFSCLPVIKGFLEFRPNRISGVILNNMSKAVFSAVKEAVEKELPVAVLGYVPKLTDLVLESRHLGLVLPDEVTALRDKLNRLAGVLEETLDLDGLLRIAGTAPVIQGPAPAHGVLDRPVRVALASDETFCFTYEDNLALLRECGAELVPFSPMRDEQLPAGVAGVILSGGYPELHGAALSGNLRMRTELRKKIAGGLPCLAECGGFMYLHEQMEDADGRVWPMVGAIKGEVHNTGRLTRFGYVTLTGLRADSLAAGGVKGHEFHYWDSTNPGSDWEAVKASGRTYRCGHEEGNLVAGFPHLYYYSQPDVAYRFLRRCRGYANSEIKSGGQHRGCPGDQDHDHQADQEQRQRAKVLVTLVEGLRDYVAECHKREQAD